MKKPSECKKRDNKWMCKINGKWREVNKDYYDRFCSHSKSKPFKIKRTSKPKRTNLC